MQQHTGQHLLSAVMDKYDNLKTLGWGIGSDETMNYVDLPRKPTSEEMQSIQRRCNELIRNNLPITVETPEDAKQDKLPGDYDKSKGIIRVIRIGDLDSNT
jgi:misacylated tRNA(Ala) deacylase